MYEKVYGRKGLLANSEDQITRNGVAAINQFINNELRFFTL